MSGSDNRLWIIITAVGAIALMALGWVLGVSPKLAEMGAASEQKLQVDSLNAGYEAQLAKLAADSENLDQIKSDLADAQSQLPPNASYPEFLTELNTIAGANGVVVTNLVFTGSSVLAAGADPAADPAAPPAAVDASLGAPVGSIVAISTSITLTGALADLRAAASALQKGDRLFLVSGLNFTTAGGDAEASGTDSLVVNGLLYVLTDTSTLVIDVDAAPVITPAPTETPAP